MLAERDRTGTAKETVMKRIRPIRPTVAVLAGLATVLLASAATPAFAMIAPAGGASAPPGSAGASVAPAQLPPVVHTVTRTVVTGGMPGWQIALIAVGAALLAAALAVLVDRVLATRRQALAAA
jgi:hypothetical protein